MLKYECSFSSDQAFMITRVLLDQVERKEGTSRMMEKKEGRRMREKKAVRKGRRDQ